MGKPKEISVNIKGKTGLTNKQVSEVLNVIKQARRAGNLPPMTYEYNPHTLLFGKDPLHLKPKTAPLKGTAVKVRSILRQHFGSKYTVRLV